MVWKRKPISSIREEDMSDEDMSDEERFHAEVWNMEFATVWRLDDSYEKIIYTHAQLPSTFFINRESRCETLRYYKLGFQRDAYESRIYFRQGADIPCLPWYDLEEFQDCAELADTKELMLMTRTYVGSSNEREVFRIGEMEKETRDRFRAMTGLHVRKVLEVCPKVEWVYWYNNCGCEVDPWEARVCE